MINYTVTVIGHVQTRYGGAACRIFNLHMQLMLTLWSYILDFQLGSYCSPFIIACLAIAIWTHLDIVPDATIIFSFYPVCSVQPPCKYCILIVLADATINY